MRFKIGDKVRIRPYKEEYQYQSPLFCYPRKDYCGEDFFIGDFAANGDILYKGWRWNGLCFKSTIYK